MAYNLYSRSFLNWALNTPENQELFDWSLDTYSPDEHVWGTLIRMPNAPGQVKKDHYTKARFVLWKEKKQFTCHGHYRHSICVFETGDTEYLMDRLGLFANKFDCNNPNSQAAVAIIEKARNDGRKFLPKPIARDKCNLAVKAGNDARKPLPKTTVGEHNCDLAFQARGH